MSKKQKFDSKQIGGLHFIYSYTLLKKLLKSDAKIVRLMGTLEKKMKSDFPHTNIYVTLVKRYSKPFPGSPEPVLQFHRVFDSTNDEKLEPYICDVTQDMLDKARGRK